VEAPRRKTRQATDGGSGTILALAVVVIGIVFGGGWAACRWIAASQRSTTPGAADGSAKTDKSSAQVRASRPDRRTKGRLDVALPTSAGRDSVAAGTGSDSGSRGSSGPFTAGDVGGDANSSAGSKTTSGAGTCSGLGCRVHDCAGGGSTTITGTIYDPAGKRPLYGVVAYVPSTAPLRFGGGASCTSCADLYSGDPVASAITDAAGNFTINDAPDGTDIPLVIQVGRWRRQFVVPNVGRCTATRVPDRTLTLPKNGSEGDLPNIAISTGGGDALECLLRRIGVDDTEYVPGPGGNGHLHIFKGSDHRGVDRKWDTSAPDMQGGAPDPSTTLWDSIADIMRYDMVLLSCEGYEPPHMNQEVMFEYVALGGRVYASHFHYAWFDTGPFGAANLAQWTSGVHQASMSLSANIVTATWPGQPFPRGQAFYEWLANVDALTGAELPLETPSRYNAYVTARNTASQPWIVANNQSGATLNFSFDTPLGAAPVDRCGRVVFSDVHVGARGDYAGQSTKVTPTGCATGDLRPQEKALEFILFDLASCVTPGNALQEPPTN
jgi:hypothetical protein